MWASSSMTIELRIIKENRQPRQSWRCRMILDLFAGWRRGSVGSVVFCVASFLFILPGQTQEEWTWTTRSGKVQSKAEFEGILADHRLWLSSQGLRGRRSLLDRTDLRGADLRDETLSRAGLAFADLSDATLSGADLSEANLEGASLKGASLNSVNLERARLNGANLTGADLAGANLIRAKLVRVNLNGANLAGANLNGADLIISSLGGAVVNGANLQDVALVGADLRGADLSGALLVNANLTGAKLSDANLSNTDLNHAKLDGANLSEANLKGIKSELGLYFDGDTVWPADFSPPRNLNFWWDRLYLTMQRLGINPSFVVGGMIFVLFVILLLWVRSAMRRPAH